MAAPTYLELVTAYPAYGVTSGVYTQLDIQARLDEATLLFPTILSCLPLANHQLAYYYALRYSFEIEDCESPVPIKQISSRNDSVTYALVGNGNLLGNTTWGSKLNRLFKLHGCFHKAGGLGLPCGGCRC